MTRPKWILRAVLIAIAALAIAVPVLVVRYAPLPHPVRAVLPSQRPVVTKEYVPPVDPVEYQSLSPEDARQVNDEVPFSTDPIPAARPFRFAGPADARARATDCLAAAVWYEAGDDAVGEKAVAQVVLNRLRHPAFPKTVCGVVFQGSERSTGCQFTFTCDGALARTPSDAAWRRARDVASAALSGSVDRTVGYATHYHTDWVVPYWRSSLDKIAEVHTHLFYRWTGWWGTPPAFRRQVLSDEPAIAKLAPLSVAHQTAAALAEADAAVAGATPMIDGATGSALTSQPDANTFVILLDAEQPAAIRPRALSLCGERPYCKVLGWTDRAALPASAVVSPQQRAAMSFSYLRDRSTGFEKMLWNCAQFQRPDSAQCMKRQVLMTAAPVTPPPAVTTVVTTELGGVRRRIAPAATPTPVPQPTATVRPRTSPAGAP